MATLYEKESSPDQLEIYRVGDTFIVTRGEYDDYSIMGRYKVRRDFYPARAFKAFVRKTLREEYADSSENNPDMAQAVFALDMEEKFLKHLEADGIIAATETRIMHMGGYGDIEITTGKDYYKAVLLNPVSKEDREADDDDFFKNVWTKHDLKEL